MRSPQGNHFEIEGSTASTTLIDLDGCDGVVVRGNDFGSEGGLASAHVKEARCTNCTVDNNDASPPAPPPPAPPQPPPAPTPPPSQSCAGDVTLSQFGAVPDDGKDDTAAIQAALNR